MSIDAQANAEPTELTVVSHQELHLQPNVADFDAFFATEYPRLVTLLTAVCGHRASAEELAQEAMLRAHQKWSRISRYELPGAWLRRVAINLAHNHRSRRRTERRLLVELAGTRRPAVATVSAGCEADEFWATVRKLPRRQSAAIALHYLEDRPVTEVAEILGCAEGTAKAHLHKGRANLARLIEHPKDAP